MDSMRVSALNVRGIEKVNSAKTNAERINMQMKTQEHANSVTTSVRDVTDLEFTIVMTARISRFSTMV